MKRSRNHGFSLTELLIAMLIGLLLIALALHSYTELRRHIKTADELIMINDRLNFAAEVNTIRMRIDNRFHSY